MLGQDGQLILIQHGGAYYRVHPCHMMKVKPDDADEGCTSNASLEKDDKFVNDKSLVLSYIGDPTKILQEALDIELKETEKDKMIIIKSKCHIIG